ncbi:RT23 protein, partial [Atractosteus spatula]|nr:RT23 protein [Atractosteus spatula]
MSRNTLQHGDVDGARRLGRVARTLSIISIVLGIFVVTIYAVVTVASWLRLGKPQKVHMAESSQGGVSRQGDLQLSEKLGLLQACSDVRERHSSPPAGANSVLGPCLLCEKVALTKVHAYHPLGVRDLMRAGVVKEGDRPLWYDVYVAFPPKKEPLYQKPISSFGKVADKVPDILYKEDNIRAKFYEVYGNGPRVLDLTKTSFVSTSQKFVEKYQELENQGALGEEELFEETGKALLAEGIFLRRRGIPMVVPQGSGGSVELESRDPVLEMKLTDMLAEQQQQQQQEVLQSEPQPEGAKVLEQHTGTPPLSSASQLGTHPNSD